MQVLPQDPIKKGHVRARRRSDDLRERLCSADVRALACGRCRSARLNTTAGLDVRVAADRPTCGTVGGVGVQARARDDQHRRALSHWLGNLTSAPVAPYRH